MVVWSMAKLCSLYEDNPLLFWKENSLSFPLLSQLVSMYLGSSASSVHVESLLSTAEFILNGKRSSLTQDKLNMIVFIHDNFELIVEAAAQGIDDDSSLKVMDSDTAPAIQLVHFSCWK